MCIGGSPPAPAAPPLPPAAAPPPTPADPAVAAARQNDKDQANLIGRASTILTSSQGVLGDGNTTKKTALGQ